MTWFARQIDPDSTVAQFHLLGCVAFESAQALQRRLVYEVGEGRGRQITVLLCEHPSVLTIGRVQIGAGGTAPFVLNIPNLPEFANRFVFVQGVTVTGGAVITLTNLGDLRVDLANVGLTDTVMDAGGLERQLRCLRLPGERLEREISVERTIDIKDGGDNPIWICVTTEDGYQAWSSPIYLFR